MRFIIVLLAIMLGGCAGMLEKADQATTQTADTSAAVAETVLCDKISVGSVVRRYGSSPELAKAYWSLCFESRAKASPEILGP